MREIKFKLWDRKEKKWVRDFAIYENGNILCWNDAQACRSIAPNSENLVVSQYINLKDKNGVEIFEGDIVTWDEEGGLHEVKWYPECCCFGISGLMQITENQASKFEVVDNVFEQKQIRVLR